MLKSNKAPSINYVTTKKPLTPPPLPSVTNRNHFFKISRSPPPLRPKIPSPPHTLDYLHSNNKQEFLFRIFFHSIMIPSFFYLTLFINYVSWYCIHYNLCTIVAALFMFSYRRVAPEKNLDYWLKKKGRSFKIPPPRRPLPPSPPT